MDYKSTLNLPRTSFPMKADLPQAEPKILARWEEGRLYEKMLARRRESPMFLLHDGPPYANGDIHMGHALNKVLKDFVVRFEGMQGRRAPFLPGWDCHGLPIEYALMKELQVTKHQVDTVEFRKKARAYALKYVGIQREQFKRLGCLGDWESPYLTLEPGYVATALRTLAELRRKDFIYRDRKPVNWCWSCETALAEAEVEYEPHTSPSIYVKFALTEESRRLLLERVVRGSTGSPRTEISSVRPELVEGRTYLVIWTTTPWTLMGNVAVAVHPEAEYALRQVGPNEEWITLANLPEAARDALGLTETTHPVKRRMRGRELEGLKYEHPLGLRQGQVVLADYVSVEEGTGLVHTAPGFGAEDYLTGRQYGLEVLAPVDSQGRFTGLPQQVAQFNGKQVQAANPEVSRRLGPALIKEGRVEHDYPHCWRCHEPIIFRATDQWFLKIDQEGLRDRLLEIVETQVQWIPPVGRERISGMVKTRPDWCLSRQRLWGIPIPAVICNSCGKGTLDPRVIERFSKAIEKDPEGSDRWFSEPVERWLPGGLRCECGGTSFQRGADILDVWFDSGVSHQSVLSGMEGLRFPADLYLEGSDQHRGWFQVSLITSVALSGRAPYRAVLTHGFVVDGEGRKMSKSLGNVMAPQEVISRYGADVLRLWVASSDYSEDVRLSPEILSRVAEVYRKIRNTWRFCLANLSDFNPAEAVALQELEELDRWVLSALAGLAAEVTESYRAYAYHRVSKAIHEFCTVQLSNFYLDVIKDRLYSSHPADPRRRSAQAALFQLARTLILLMAPIVPVTAEEAWAALPPHPSPSPLGGEGRGEGLSVHLQDWPRVEDLPRDGEAEAAWGRLLELRDGVMKALEEARMGGRIGDPLEAELELGIGEEALWKLLEPRQAEFADACVVSSLKLTRTSGLPAAPAARLPGAASTGGQAQAGGAPRIGVRKAGGAKCQRCWKRLASVGKSAEHPALCERCVGVVQRVVV